MPHEYLSDGQIDRYGRFPDELSVGDLEQCFRLTPDALALARSKRTPATQLGCSAVGHGASARPLPGRPPHPGSREGGGLGRRPTRRRPGGLPEYQVREKTAYEHVWQIREAFGYREFTTGEEDLRTYLAARVWAGEEGPRALFDRAVLSRLVRRAGGRRMPA